MKAPTWTVVVPTRRREHQLRRCLGGLADQRYPQDRFEVIVVDDGGESDLEQVESTLSGRLKLRVVRQPHLGPAAARNRGAASAAGELLAFVDDDCVPAPDWLHELERALRVNPDTLIGGTVRNGLAQNAYSTASQLLIDYLCVALTHNGQPRFLTSNNLGMTRASFNECGRFDESFGLAAAEDRALSEQFRSYGKGIYRSGGPVVDHFHRLTLAGFLRQHFRYGRGAHHFRRLASTFGWGKVRIEAPGFYVRLIAFPFSSHGQPGGRLRVSALLLASQCAGLAGFLFQSVAAWLTSIVAAGMRSVHSRPKRDSQRQPGRSAVEPLS